MQVVRGYVFSIVHYFKKQSASYSESIWICIPSKQLQTLLTKIASDWQRLTDKTEIGILSQYGEEGRILVLFYTGNYAWDMNSWKLFITVYILHSIRFFGVGNVQLSTIYTTSIGYIYSIAKWHTRFGLSLLRWLHFFRASRSSLRIMFARLFCIFRYYESICWYGYNLCYYCQT